MGNRHSGHKTVSAAAEMAKKQEELKIKKRDFIQQTNDIDKEIQEFMKNLDFYKRSAQAAVENSDRIFTEIIRSIQNIQAEVREKIRAQENKEVRDAENHIQMLEQEIVKLQKENCKLETLLHSEDHVYFFQNYSFSAGNLQYNSSKDVNNLTFEKLEQSLSELKSHLDEVCKEHMGRIFNKVADVQIFNETERSQSIYHSEMEVGMEVQIWDSCDDDDFIYG